MIKMLLNDSLPNSFVEKDFFFMQLSTYKSNLVVIWFKFPGFMYSLKYIYVKMSTIYIQVWSILLIIDSIYLH